MAEPKAKPSSFEAFRKRNLIEVYEGHYYSCTTEKEKLVNDFLKGSKYIYGYKAVRKDMRAVKDMSFEYPLFGRVEPKFFDKTSICNNGLHFFVDYHDCFMFWNRSNWDWNQEPFVILKAIVRVADLVVYPKAQMGWEKIKCSQAFILGSCSNYDHYSETKKFLHSMSVQ